MNKNNSIGQRIKQRREELGVSQEDLALSLGYKSRSSINKIEKDGRELPQSKIMQIAKQLNTTPAYIMGWTDEVPANFVLSDIEKQIIIEFRKSDSIDKEMVLRVLHIAQKGEDEKMA